tara:strand:- start:3701 stop:4003 length:303 start_codon:yes stop_codon:yes gene_type:complete
MKITRRQLRQIIKEEVTLSENRRFSGSLYKAHDGLDVHDKISSVADWLSMDPANNVQKGAGHIMNQLIDLAVGNKSYDETLTVLNRAVASAKKNYPLEKK